MAALGHEHYSSFSVFTFYSAALFLHRIWSVGGGAWAHPPRARGCMLRSSGCCRNVWLSRPSCNPVGSQESLASELQGKISQRRKRKKKNPPQSLPKNDIWQTYQDFLHAKLSHAWFVKELCSTSVIRRKTVPFCCGRDRVIFTLTFCLCHGNMLSAVRMLRLRVP